MKGFLPTVRACPICGRPITRLAYSEQVCSRACSEKLPPPAPEASHVQ